MMNIREAAEQWGEKYSDPYVVLGGSTLERNIPEELCNIRPEYQRDRDRITHCEAFRRLKHKTQVFLAPEDDYYRIRLIHTLEVTQIARTISRALWLNENLTEAIALGHDLRHTPFGHSGERILSEIYEDGSTYYRQSIRVVGKLEKDGKGLNLTKRVRDGILSHRTPDHPNTLEGCVIRLSGKIAYISHDTDDTIRAKIFVESGLPEEYIDILGYSARERLNTLIHDTVENSLGKPEILMSLGMGGAVKGLCSWMFENAHENETSRAEEGKTQQLTVALCDYYMKHAEKLSEEYPLMMERNQEKRERVVCDYITGISDSYVIDKFEKLSVPRAWKAL